MKREIKFRGKRIDNDEWVTGFLVRSSEESASIVKQYGTVDISIYDVIPETVGQYAGLKDDRTEGEKMEIYEGNLVKATNKSGWTREFQIIWNEDRAGFMVWCFSQPEISFDLTCDSIINYHVIVIGNAYPNPETLGVAR